VSGITGPQNRRRNSRRRFGLEMHADSALPRLTLRILSAAGVVFLVTLTATIGFHAAGDGNASWSDALYMALITISTVGYGEIVPLDSTGERVFAGLTAFGGFGALTFLFTSLSVFFLEKDLDQTLRRRRMENRIRKLRGHYIVCGFGRVGRNTAYELQVTGRKFVAIDANPARFDEHRDSFSDLLFLHGDASDDALLEAADIEDAAGVFAVTGDDSRNLMITITAKQLNPGVRVVARAHEVRNIAKMRKAGADDVISPDFTGGMRIASAMIRPSVVNFLDEMLRSEGGLRVEEFVVPAAFAPRPVAELRLRGPGYLLLALRVREEWIFNPGGDFRVEPGHVMVVMAGAEGRAELEARIAAIAS
jgi:voltage-gated potassium channel